MYTPWILGTPRPCLPPARVFFGGEDEGSLHWQDGGVSSTIFEYFYERNFWMNRSKLIEGMNTDE